MNTTKSILKLAISIALAFTFSCSGGDDTGGGNSGSSSDSSGGGDLVNANNEAWVLLNVAGYIFKQNGEFIIINKESGNWCIVEDIYTYLVSGNEVKICYGTCQVFFESYSISGNTLLVKQGKNESLLTRTSMNTSSLIPCE